MQAACHGRWFEELLATMLLSNQPASTLCERFEIPGLTDVTGFGLAGHLLEMLKPSNLSAILNVNAIPLLSGTADLLKQGIESTLAPANRERRVERSHERVTSIKAAVCSFIRSPNMRRFVDGRSGSGRRLRIRGTSRTK